MSEEISSDLSRKFAQLDRMRDICKEFIRKYYNANPGCNMEQCKACFAEHLSTDYTKDVDGVIFDKAAKELQELN